MYTGNAVLLPSLPCSAGLRRSIYMTDAQLK